MVVSPSRSVLFLTALALALAGCAGPKEGDETKAQAKEPPPREADAVVAPKERPDPDRDMPKAFAVNGPPVTQADLKGKVVLLDFWAMWCGPCVKSFPHLRDWHQRYADQGLEILGATTYWKTTAFDKEAGRLLKVAGLTPAEERDTVRHFAAHHKLGYRVLLYSPAEWQRSSKKLNVGGYPTVVLFDRKGAVRFNQSGGQPQVIEGEIRKLLAEK